MENILLKKLRIKPNFVLTIINAPEDFQDIIGDVPDEIKINPFQSLDFNALLIFAVTKAQIIKALTAFRSAMHEQTVCWICYPKTKTALASELNLMQSWDFLNTFNLTPCAAVAINNIWTAIRVKLSHTIQKSGLSNADIQKNNFGNYIDVVNKTIKLPEDLKIEMIKAPTAYSFFERLSFTNRKEYVLWILTAKQEITRTQRIKKAIEKLTFSKKNPAEK